MSKLKNGLEHITHDIKEGIEKVGDTVKHVTKDLKEDAQGAIASMEHKKDDIMDRHEQKEFAKKLKKQMKKEK